MTEYEYEQSLSPCCNDDARPKVDTWHHYNRFSALEHWTQVKSCEYY